MRWRRVARPAGELERPDFAGGNSWIVPPHPRHHDNRPFNDAWSAERNDRGAFGRTYQNLQFMLKWLLFEADPTKDAEWGPVRVLGSGSYGRVGLWQKRDENNNAVDELALKEDVKPRTRFEPDEQIYPRLLREAVVQSELNGNDERAAPHLRRYKFISGDVAHTSGKYRFYLEFCPHDSLDRLWRLYRAGTRTSPRCSSGTSFIAWQSPVRRSTILRRSTAWHGQEQLTQKTGSMGTASTLTSSHPTFFWISLRRTLTSTTSLKANYPITGCHCILPMKTQLTRRTTGGGGPLHTHPR